MLIQKVISPAVAPVISSIIIGPEETVPQQGLLLHLDAADGSTIAAPGGLVSQWTDKSGNGNNATQFTGSVQPTFLATGINGKGAVEMVGISGPFMTLTSRLAESNLTAIAVFVNTETTGGGFILADSIQNHQIIRILPTSGAFGAQIAFAASQTAIFNFTSSITGTTLLLRSQFALPGNISIFLDGVFKNSIVSQSAVNLDTIGRLLGAVLTLGGRIGELLVYDRILGAQEILALENNLSDKWGI